MSDQIEIARLRALLTAAREVMRDFATNWDCDSDAHKYGMTCRVCVAQEMQYTIDAAILPEEDEGETPGQHFAKCGLTCTHVTFCGACANTYGACGAHRAYPGRGIIWRDGKRP